LKIDLKENSIHINILDGINKITNENNIEIEKTKVPRLKDEAL
jgi:hypothetical protein